MEKPLLYRMSFSIVNLAALFLTFLAFSTSHGRWWSWRNDMIEVIQLPVFWIPNVEISSILGCFWASISKPMLVDPSFDDANFAISSAIIFWLLGICTNSTLSNSWVRRIVSLRYFYILSSFASYSSFICLITSLESLWRSKFLAPSAFPTLSLVSTPSYSPFRVIMITPTPPFF